MTRKDEAIALFRSPVVTVSLVVGLVITSLGWNFSLRPAAADWGSVSDVVMAIGTSLILFGLIPAYRQVKSGIDAVRAQQQATKVNLLMHLEDEWRSDRMYRAAIYVHQIRDEWIATGGHGEALAEAWVAKNHQRQDEATQLNWSQRRHVAQYLTRVGRLLVHGLLEPDEVFSIVPESHTLLEVLLPIENAIIGHFGRVNGKPNGVNEIGRKWELEVLLEEHAIWRKNHQGDRFGLHPRSAIPVSIYKARGGGGHGQATNP